MIVAERGYMAAQLITPHTATLRKKAAVRDYVEQQQRRPRLRYLFLFFKLTAVLLVMATAITAHFTYRSYQTFAEMVDRQIAGGYLRGHAGLYASPRVIEKGARLSKEQLVTSLQKAGYVSGATSNIWSGSFSQRGDAVRISPRQHTEKYEWVEINFNQQQHITSLATSEGLELPSYILEPELLTDDAGLKIGEQKTLTFKDLPPVLVNAIVAIEDRRFFQHSGLDLRGIARAFVSWVGDGRFQFHQGGSTITQQLVKNTYLTPEKTLQRKFNEAMIALALEQRLSKEDIFALYCNEIYLGQRQGLGVRGVAQAAKVYFGKELKDLSLTEAATIAGMIQSPARYAPDRHPEAARERRNQVLSAMSTIGLIDHAVMQETMAVPVEIAASENNSNQFAPYYVDAVNRAVEMPNSESKASTGRTCECKRRSIPISRQPLSAHFVSNWIC
jgi:penicillin-binding protein 1B